MGVLERFFLLSEPWSSPEQALILSRVGAGVTGPRRYTLRKVPWLGSPKTWPAPHSFFCPHGLRASVGEKQGIAAPIPP